jgi:aryl-alcohol dehydrogenase-like predicted oxidoreductase
LASVNNPGPFRAKPHGQAKNSLAQNVFDMATVQNVYNLTRAIAEIASAHDATAGQVALAWLLARSPVMMPIPGTGSVENLEENVEAAELQLTADEVARLDEATAAQQLT